jgi:RNA polymerase sigma-70 factor (ECF subfamily)
MVRGLGRALARLTDRQRAAVLLRHQQGMSYPEIAAALGVPQGTAKTLVHRGVMMLRDILEAGQGEPRENGAAMEQTDE